VFHLVLAGDPGAAPVLQGIKVSTFISAPAQTLYEGDRGARLLLLAAEGDRGAFSELYHLFINAVQRYIAKRICNVSRDQVEDLAQEVFVRAWHGRHRFGARATAKTYLSGIARNVVLEYYDRMRRTRRDLSYAPQRAPDLTRCLDFQELRDRLNSEMASLSHRQQEAIRLVFFGGMTAKEAAQLTHCTTRAIQRRIPTAVMRFRSTAQCCRVQGTFKTAIPSSCPASVGLRTCLKYLYVSMR